MFVYWCLVYVEMLVCDESCLQDVFKCLDVSLLGCGVLVGMVYEIDCEQLVGWLGFVLVICNSFDSVFDCDYVLELFFVVVIGMVYLLCFVEDLIFFNIGEVGFVEFFDCVIFGLLLMLQKKNLDVLELICGKCGWVQGVLIGMMMMLKGLLLVYNKDMQEDKEGLFDVFDIWLDCLYMVVLVLDGIQVKCLCCQEVVQQGYVNVIELVDYLVVKGVLFCEVYYIVGEVVVEVICQGKLLEDLLFSELQKFSQVIDEDVYLILLL